MLGYGVLASAVIAAWAICIALILNYVMFPWHLRVKTGLKRQEAGWIFVGVWIAMILLATVFSGEELVDGIIGFGGLSILPFLCYLMVAARAWPKPDGRIRGN